jgi:hypothetical protein
VPFILSEAKDLYFIGAPWCSGIVFRSQKNAREKQYHPHWRRFAIQLAVIRYRLS